MVYSNKELERVENILESDKACKHIDALDSLIGDDLPNASEMIEDSIRNYKKKSMYISRAVFLKDGEKIGEGVAIEVENNSGDGYDVHSYYKIEDGKLSIKMVNTLLNLNYSGYELRTSKETNEVEISLDIKKEDFKCW